MANRSSVRHFLKLSDFEEAEIRYMLDESLRMKALRRASVPHPYLAGKILAMVFEKSSTRTRVSFEVAMKHLGGDAIFLSSQDLQLGRGESVQDTAKVLSGYVDGIMVRTFAHTKIEDLAEAASVPVFNGLTDLHHPAQVMADLLTILECKGRLTDLKLAFIGDGNNMANSLIEGAAKVGMDIAVAAPPGYHPDSAIVSDALQEAARHGSQVVVTDNPQEAAAGADILYTDVWASMGQEQEQATRARDFADYQINATLAALAQRDFLFLHCLPAHRGEEVTAEIIDGPHSRVFLEAENRLHAQKGILKYLMGVG